MDKKSNVIPFFRFPDPKTATYNPQVLIDLDMALEKAFNNPALKQFGTTLDRVIGEARAYDEVLFVSGAITEADPEFYAPEPVPDYCYQTKVYFRKWILEFQFFGAGDVTRDRISNKGMTHFIQGPQATLEKKGTELDFLQRLWVMAGHYIPMMASLRSEDAHIATFQFTRFDNTRVEVYIRPVEDRG